MNPELVDKIGRLSIGTIAVCGLIWVLHTAIDGDASEKQFLQDHMSRQTAALEQLVRVYTGN